MYKSFFIYNITLRSIGYQIITNWDSIISIAYSNCISTYMNFTETHVLKDYRECIMKLKKVPRDNRNRR